MVSVSSTAILIVIGKLGNNNNNNNDDLIKHLDLRVIKHGVTPQSGWEDILAVGTCWNWAWVIGPACSARRF